MRSVFPQISLASPRLELTADNKLVITKNGEEVWSSGCSGANTGAGLGFLVVKDNGKLGTHFHFKLLYSVLFYSTTKPQELI